MRKFESHLTFNIAHAEQVEQFATRSDKTMGNMYGVKFSRIDGDAQMGAKPFCYLTAYDTNARELAARMALVSSILAEQAIPTLRTKIEEIIYDTKTGHDVLN